MIWQKGGFEPSDWWEETHINATRALSEQQQIKNELKVKISCRFRWNFNNMSEKSTLNLHKQTMEEGF